MTKLDLLGVSAYLAEKLSTIEATQAPLEFIIQLNRLTQNPNADITKIARLIEREPNICAQLLRLSNSAFFARGQRISTVNQAIMRLGLDTVKRIITSFEFFDLASDKLAFPFFNQTEFLKNSIAGGMIAEEVARKIRFEGEKEIYVCTLLRDFGVFVLKQYFPDIFREIFRVMLERQWPFRLSCLIVTGMDHHHMTAKLFSRWELPITIASVFSSDEAERKKLIATERIFGHVDYILKKFDYGQWDPFGIPSTRSINLFSTNSDFIASMRKTMDEAEAFMKELGKGEG